MADWISKITPENQRQGRTRLGAGLQGVLKAIDSSEDGQATLRKAIRAQKVLDLFRQCMTDFYQENDWLMLQKTNAVYIIHEKDKGMKKEASPDDKDIIKLVVYTCDSTVHAELDSRQEQIKLWFAKQNEKLDRVELIHSSLNMRRRAPYSDYVSKKISNNHNS